MVKKALILGMCAIFLNSPSFSYSPVLEAKVVCLKVGEKLDAAKFKFEKIEPIRQEQTCYALVHYVELPPEKTQAAQEAARIVYQRLGKGKK